MGVILQILLWILKLLGILFLVVLGVVLLVLVVPIRYEVSGEADDPKKVGQGRVSWFLRALSVRFSFDEEFTYSVKVLGIRILPKKEPELSEPQASDEPELTEVELLPEVTEPVIEPMIIRDPVDEVVQNMPKPEAVPEGAKTEPDNIEAETSQKEPLSDKLKALWAKFQEIKAMVLDKGNQTAVKLMLGQVARILKHIMPRTLRAKGVFGFDDPATTGQVTGVLAMLMPLYQDAIQVVPDFEQKRLEGKVHLKGHIRLGIFVVVAVRLIIDKNVRGLIKQVMGLLKPNKGGRKNGRKQ